MGYKTAVKIEWTLPRACAKFNVLIAIEKLINKLIQIDPTLYAQSSVSAAVWKTTKDIPKKSEFTKELDIKQKSFKKGPNHVHAYITIISKSKLNTIKLTTKFLHFYRKTTSIFTQIDSNATMYQAQESSLNCTQNLSDMTIWKKTPSNS
eukprot:2669292-Ditylum_brightwellii.AAC.1